jgi:uncharacterized protein
MVTYAPVSAYQSLVGRSGSRVQFGNLLILPFQDSLLYLRPVYAKEEQSGRYTLTKVAVTSGDSVGFGDTVELALQDLLDGNEDGATGQPATDASGQTTGTVPTPSTTLPAGPDGRTPTQLLAAADQKFTEADDKLRKGDLGGYQAAVAQARTLVNQATASIGSATPATTVPTTAPAAPTTTVAPAGRT